MEEEEEEKEVEKIMMWGNGSTGVVFPDCSIICTKTFMLERSAEPYSAIGSEINEEC